MVAFSVICAHLAPTGKTESSVIEQQATESSNTNPNTLPNFGASQQKQAAPAAKDGGKKDAQQPAATGSEKETPAPAKK